MSPRILVVDDEAMIRDSIGALLRSDGYEVDTAATGEEGVRAVRRTRYHLVLLDLKMPGMGGLDALRRMRAHDPGLPVVIFTGYSTEESLREALGSLGAVDYLRKPLESLALREAIRHHLRGPG